MKDKTPNTDWLKKISHHEKGETEFEIPKGYFEKMQKSIFNKVQTIELDDDFFQTQQDRILLKIKLASADKEAEFSAPPAYFEQAEKTLVQKAVSEDANKVVSLKRFFISISAAACLAAAIYFVLPAKNIAPTKTNFSQMLAESTLEEQDFLNMLSDEELNSLFISNLDEMPDGAVTFDMLDFVLSEQTNQSGQKEISTMIKPLENKTTLTFETLSEEEMIQYLLDEESDLLNDY